MQRYFPVESVTFLCEEVSWEHFSTDTFAPFDALSLAFIADLSAELLSLASSSPNLASLGFFLRPTAINRQKERLGNLANPLGLAFHLSPSNVATVSVFSWVTSLLSGCPAIVRLSSKLVEEQIMLFNSVGRALQKHPEIRQRVRFIQYPHSDETNRRFSELASVRVLWGGDDTLSLFKSYSLDSSPKDLCFADRRSFAVIDLEYCDTFNSAERTEQIRRLAGDMATYDQLACSSPVLLILLGGEDRAAKFLGQLAPFLEERQTSPRVAIEQFINLQLISAAQSGLRVNRNGSWNFVGLSTAKLSAQTKPQHGNVLYCSLGIDDLEKFEFERKPQTCVVLADDSVKARIKTAFEADRFVSPSQALLHDWVWDGIDLLSSQAC